MKILSNFDTKLDKKVFLKKIEEYGDGNVLLVKRHPLFLYKAFLYGLVAFLFFLGLLGVIYFEYIGNPLYFYIFGALHLLGVGMWILLLFKKIMFNLFDYREFIKKKKHLDRIDFNDFGVFLQYSFFLFLYQIIISIADVYTLYKINADFFLVLVHIGINFILLVLAWSIIKRFIDFEMDFIVATKDEVELFDQSGIFKKKIVSLDMKKFRTITTYKEGFWRSLFNIGSLTILSEGSFESPGKIKFNYIHKLGGLKKNILKLVHEAESENIALQSLIEKKTINK